ncbi:alpha/beta hydrolase [Bosea sp. (in: a-proteobacteria)]|uniref:alpha/beta hydrolase n=1 Tax=Bosea sp. (in: a-proteobacteria) TaxID=1871050 RepID=UPI0026048996|nr:alpha/beta hydrolase [Bosea sp. (in: a-proteobacteria)]MCO5091007.1 alpha/beta hydrolase [Bosea sp. (in: a-proteobacteria)]
MTAIAETGTVGGADAALDPDAAAYLDLLKSKQMVPIERLSPQEARDRHEAVAAAIPEALEPVAEIADGMVGPLPLRRYRPARSTGTTVFVHGGGWVTGTIESYDRFCRVLANRSSTTVVSIGYDLSPEVRHPVAIEQVLAALPEIARDAGGRVALAGDSAGAYLCAQVAARLGPACRETIAGLVLLYPIIDPALDTRSATTRARGYRLETEGLRWYWRHYLATEGVPASLYDADLSGFPPTLLLAAGYDPLHDEGERFAGLLQRAGVRVLYRDYPGQIHGFMRIAHAIRAADGAYEEVAGFIRGLFGQADRRGHQSAG